MVVDRKPAPFQRSRTSEYAPSDDTTRLLEDAIGKFKEQFTTTSGEPLVKDEPVPAMDEEDVELATIRRQRRSEQEVREAAGPAGRGTSSPAP